MQQHTRAIFFLGLIITTFLATGWVLRLIAAEHIPRSLYTLAAYQQPPHTHTQPPHPHHAILIPAPMHAAASSLHPPIPTPSSPLLQPTTDQATAKALIAGIFGAYTEQADRIVQCESGFNSTAYNPTPVLSSHAEGLFQILYPSTWISTAQAHNNPYNASANAQAAWEIFSRDGYNWHEWACAALVGLS